MVSYVDHKIGLLLDALEKTGAADHTAIYRPTSLLSIHRCSVFQPLGHCS